MNPRLQEFGIALALCIALTIGGCIQDSVFVAACEVEGVYVSVTAPDKLIECYTVEHINENGH